VIAPPFPDHVSVEIHVFVEENFLFFDYFYVLLPSTVAPVVKSYFFGQHRKVFALRAVDRVLTTDFNVGRSIRLTQ
jgi:hypothetical protein